MRAHRQLMHDDDVLLPFTTQEQAHRAALTAYTHAKTLLAMRPGARFRLIVGEDREDLTVRQRRFWHGVVLAQIAEQARVGGERYVMKVWKEYFRNLILGHTYEMVKMPGQKRATPRKSPVSTESLSVKQYSELIDRTIAHAVTDLGVVFDFDSQEREAVRYVEPRRAHKAETVPA